jgi:transcriptional regulator with XRE-family HTH domain
MLNLRELRLSKGYNIDEFVKIAGVAKNTLHKVETGTRIPSAYFAIKVAKALDIDYRDLFEDIEQELGYERND